MESLIVKNCAPVLGGLKTGGLFNCSFDKNRLESEVKALNKILCKKGIYIFILKQTSEFSLIYVCRKSKLLKDVESIDVKTFLRIIGYADFRFEALIETLRRRFSQNSVFPHEIGIFLGYPLADVKGFIKNKGGNFKLCGCWKVYNDEKYAKTLFARFDKCSEIYSRLFSTNRRTLEQLTVTA